MKMIQKIKKLLSAFKNHILPQVSSFLREIDSRPSKKIRITVDKGEMEYFIKMQTPSRKGLVNNVLFVSRGFADVNVVINKPNPLFKLSTNIEKNWLLHIEPPSYVRLLGLDNPSLMEKFSRVYTSDPNLYRQGGKFIPSPPYVHWHVGGNAYTKSNNLIDYDFLKSANLPKKKWNLSVINSNLNNISGHKLRSDFIEKLCQSGLDFKLFGGSNWSKFNQYVDSAPFGKWAVFNPAKYVLVIENEVAPYYWSEKFADALLCFCIPIYYGCPNISNYFPHGSFIHLDIKSPNAINTLKNILESNFYESNINALIEARNLVLTKFNMFSFLSNELNSL